MILLQSHRISKLIFLSILYFPEILQNMVICLQKINSFISSITFNTQVLLLARAMRAFGYIDLFCRRISRRQGVCSFQLYFRRDVTTNDRWFSLNVNWTFLESIHKFIENFLVFFLKLVKIELNIVLLRILFEFQSVLSDCYTLQAFHLLLLSLEVRLRLPHKAGEAR